MPSLLTNAHRGALYEALRHHFKAEQVKRMVSLRIDPWGWDEIPGTSWADRSYELMRWAERQGVVPRLLAAMHDMRPDVSDITRLCVDLEVGSSMAQCSADGVERVIESRLPFLDAAPWYERYGRIMRQVCRVRTPRAGGTGFLVGDQAVLTAHHVVAGVERIRLRFDHFHREDGLDISLGPDAVVCHSAANPDELRGDTAGASPTADQLDFALLRLPEPVGSARLDPKLESLSKTRGTMTLPVERASIEADAPIVILQHPKGSPQRLAIDTKAWLGVVHEGRRVRYRTNTDEGTSGSPVFDFHWNLMALHHYGSGHYGFNQGVPIECIRAAIVEAGYEGLLAGD